MKQLVIEESNAKKLYPQSTGAFKLVLEDTFGKDFFSEKITDRVKTFDDACKVLGIDPDDIFDGSEDSDEIAYKKLKVIARALNEGWEPNWNDGNQRKWYPWFYLNEPGFRLFGVFCGCSGSHVGARLVFKSEELAKYAANQFSGVYSDFFEL